MLFQFGPGIPIQELKITRSAMPQCHMPTNVKLFKMPLSATSWISSIKCAATEILFKCKKSFASFETYKRQSRNRGHECKSSANNPLG
jgi:hypothetical protein